METTLQFSELTRETILNIINDALIFERMCQGVMKLFNNGSDQWCVIQGDYKGFMSVIDTFGYEDNSPMPELLQSIFYNHADTSVKPELAAQEIYKEWVALIEESNLL